MDTHFKYVLFSFVFQERFTQEILDTKYQLPPKLLFVFSYLNPDSLKYFLLFEKLRKKLDCIGVPLQLRLMNIGKRRNLLGKFSLFFASMVKFLWALTTTNLLKDGATPFCLVCCSSTYRLFVHVYC